VLPAESREPTDVGDDERGQHLCHRVLSVAGSGFLIVAPRCIGMPPATRKPLPVESRRLAQLLFGLRHGGDYGTQESVNSF
jgi:uncharacterized protein YheU (UPF0270 family)